MGARIVYGKRKDGVIYEVDTVILCLQPMECARSL